MLAILNLGVAEMILIAVVAILVFGRNLPSVAVQAASTVQRMRRSLADLRRETGIDDELRRARREFEEAVPRDLPSLAKHSLEAIQPDPRPEPADESSAGDGTATDGETGDREDLGRPPDEARPTPGAG